MGIVVRTLVPIVSGVLALAFTLAGPALPAPTARALSEPEGMELKLIGQWAGPACGGELIFRADGTYEWRHRGPGGTNSAGGWKLRWDALRPALTMRCVTSDDPADMGGTLELKLRQVGEAALVFDLPGSANRHYARVWK
jgi:hypothetical protein